MLLATVPLMTFIVVGCLKRIQSVECLSAIISTGSTRSTTARTVFHARSTTSLEQLYHHHTNSRQAASVSNNSQFHRRRNHCWDGDVVAVLPHRYGCLHFTSRFTQSSSSFALHSTSTSNDDGNNTHEHLSMENIYSEWSLQDDEMLWENRNESIVKIASKLGRGFQGVERRLRKLKNVDSSAYQRLFVGATKSDEDVSNTDSPPKKKLVPASEVLRRFEWDNTLNVDDFTVMHYDRIEDRILETPMNASNDAIAGSARSFIDALPEHRIMGVKYKQRIVWDRTARIDLVFGGNGGIETVIAEYPQWKAAKDAEQELYRKRNIEVSQHIRNILGQERYDSLKQLSKDTLETVKDNPKVSLKQITERYVDSAIGLFRQVRKDQQQQDQSTTTGPVPTTDADAFGVLSDLIALLPNEKTREMLLQEVSIRMMKARGKKTPARSSNQYELPQINEDDIEESFIRGSGAGGQKINKTSSCVMLLHTPTQLTVQCQETRSLPQNRKLARKRLRVKLDEYYNGNQSRTSIKAAKQAKKKSKNKSKSRARQRKKQQQQQQSD